MAIVFLNRTLGRITNQKIFHRPLLLAAIISLVIIVWLGLSAYRLVVDQPLPPEKISSQRLRVDTDQFNSLQTAITAYQSPTASGDIKTGLFAPAPK